MKNIEIDENELIMKRFNGLERYKIKNATWNLYEDEGKMNLCFLIDSDKAIEQGEDTKSFFQSLNWELNLVEETMDEETLIKGFEADIPESYDEDKSGYLTNFYFAEHEGSENNHITILDSCNDELFVEISGEITDVNYYDGSKEDSKILVRIWFKKNKDTIRSIY